MLKKESNFLATLSVKPVATPNIPKTMAFRAAFGLSSLHLAVETQLHFLSSVLPNHHFSPIGLHSFSRYSGTIPGGALPVPRTAWIGPIDAWTRLLCSPRDFAGGSNAR